MPVPLLDSDQIARLPERAREVVEYRKSGLSLNHIQGCSLGCAYCIRHTYGLWDENQPRALMTDAAAVEELVNHRYFQPHITPIQLSVHGACARSPEWSKRVSPDAFRAMLS